MLAVSTMVMARARGAPGALAPCYEWGRGRMQGSTFIGLDVHKATIAVAVSRCERGGEVRH